MDLKELPKKIETVQDAIDFYVWVSDAYTSNRQYSEEALHRIMQLAVDADVKCVTFGRGIISCAGSLAIENKSKHRA